MPKTNRPTARTARTFLAAALALVESERIRTWATSAHNLPVWEGEALARLRVGRSDVHNLATSIVAHAIGL